MTTIDPQEVADRAPFNRFHALLLALCTLLIVADGYDLAVVGVALPVIMKDMGVAPTAAGFMASAAIVGMMLGAIVFGTLADRIGRLRIMALCVIVFSVGTAATGQARDPVWFSALRFLAGIGIGGIMPCVVATMTEFAPRRHKSIMVTIAFSGMAIGGMAAALLGKGLIARHGWSSVFHVAVLPIVLIPAILLWMPESMRVLMRDGREGALRRVLARLSPGTTIAGDVRFALPTQGASRASVGDILADGRGRSSVMLWTSTFMCLVVLYGIGSWLAKLLVADGLDLSTALTLLVVLNVGALVGSVASGWLADRYAICRVLIGCYAIAGLGIVALGFPLPLVARGVVIAVIGATVYGAQTLTFAFAGQFYPATARTTGVGWTTAVGRVGAILGPIAVGALVAMQWSVEQTLIGMAVPAFIAVVAVALIDGRRIATPRAPGEAIVAH